MPLTPEQYDLLLKATNKLPEKIAKIFSKQLMAMIEENNWFYEKLFFSLSKGLVFKISNTLEPLARFDPWGNRIIINPSYFIDNLSEPIMNRYLTWLLRHEITHAVDYYNNAVWSVFSELPTLKKDFSKTVRDRANLFFNQMTCIAFNNIVNTSKLDEFSSKIMHRDPGNEVSSLVLDKKLQSLLLDDPTFISDIGAYPQEKFYILNTYPFKEMTASIVLITTDTALVYERIQDHKNKWQSDFFKRAMALQFTQSLGKNQRSFWESLSKNQRRTLDALMVTYVRMLQAVQKDDFCYPQYESCFYENRINCSSTFQDCLSSVDTQLSKRNLWEIHAIMQERIDEELLSQTSLKELCRSPVSMPLSKITGVKANSYELFYSFGYSAGLNFLSDFTKAYTVKEGYQLDNQERLSLIVDMIYALMVGYLRYSINSDEEASTTQIMLPVVLVIIQKRILEPITNYLASDTLAKVVKYGSNAVAIGMSLKHEGIKITTARIFSSIVGSVSGSMGAKYVASLLGWKHPATRASLQQPDNQARMGQAEKSDSKMSQLKNLP